MAKIAKTGDRKKEMDTTKSTDCPKCSKPTRIVKRVKDRERGIPGGVYISCSACDFYENFKFCFKFDPQKSPATRRAFSVLEFLFRVGASNWPINLFQRQKCT